jgi:hypothetical protein
MNTAPQASIDPDRIAYLQEQEALFAQAKSDLLAQYLGEFVAFEANKVLDHDLDEQKLVERVYQSYGYRDILIKKVLHHDPQLFVRGTDVPVISLKIEY